jgi:hypothetical protein
LLDRARICGENFNPRGRKRFDPFKQFVISRRSQNSRDADSQSKRYGADAQSAANSIYQESLTGPDAALAKRGIGCSEVAEPSRVFERNIGRQLDHSALGRSLELAEPTVRIIVEQHLRIAGEAKIALKNCASAKRDSIRAACAAGAAASERIHVDPFTDRDIVNAVANLGDDACCIKTKSRWQFGQRLVGKPSFPIGQDIAQVRNNAASFDLQQNIGRTRPRRWNRVEAHGLPHGVKTRREHCLGDGYTGLLQLNSSRFYLSGSARLLSIAT